MRTFKLMMMAGAVLAGLCGGVRAEQPAAATPSCKKAPAAPVAVKKLGAPYVLTTYVIKLDRAAVEPLLVAEASSTGHVMTAEMALNLWKTGKGTLLDTCTMNLREGAAATFENRRQQLALSGFVHSMRGDSKDRLIPNYSGREVGFDIRASLASEPAAGGALSLALDMSHTPALPALTAEQAELVGQGKLSVEESYPTSRGCKLDQTLLVRPGVPFLLSCGASAADPSFTCYIVVLKSL